MGRKKTRQHVGIGSLLPVIELGLGITLFLKWKYEWVLMGTQAGGNACYTYESGLCHPVWWRMYNRSSRTRITNN
ncbi:MAG: hypothetical protein U5J95_02795 [Balneolaceae bacterium]|nr:hypothetical protein [Balneolaceae bacterium]